MSRKLLTLVVACLAALVTVPIALTSRRSAIEPPGVELNRSAPTYSAEGQSGPYDPSPKHIWNRLYRQFFVRTARDGTEFGIDELDPLLWWETKYLITGPSHQQAMTLLDEFLATHAERLIADPLKRAMLQRDLWAIFDWLNLGDDNRLPREELQAKLVQAIRRLALSPDQIKRLPDNYSAAIKSKLFPAQYQSENSTKSFLPPELLQTVGPWVVIGDERGRITAPVHAQSSPFGGRSTFLVLMRLPGGRDATLSYLQQLRKFPRPMVYNTGRAMDSEPMIPNPDLPQFPEGTQLALVRRLILIDDQGNLTPTSLTESVQIRVYRSIPAGIEIREMEARRTQDVFEFRLDRKKLFGGEAGGLREVLREETDFMLFRAHGIDWFEKLGDPESAKSSALNQCASCHASPGIHSVLSYSERRFQPSIRPPAFTESKISDQENMFIGSKQRQYEWGLLRGFWQASR